MAFNRALSIVMAAALAGGAAAAPSSIEIPQTSPFPESVIAAPDGAMPPKGGVDALSDDDVQALAAYVWAISRHKK